MRKQILIICILALASGGASCSSATVRKRARAINAEVGSKQAVDAFTELLINSGEARILLKHMDEAAAEKDWNTVAEIRKQLEHLKAEMRKSND